MGGHRFLVPVAFVGAALLLATPADAQRRARHERRVPQANVVVRDVTTRPLSTQPVTVREVQVRDVKVAPPVVTPPRAVERPSFGGMRPVLPPSISRPGATFSRPRGRAVHARRQHDAFRPRVGVGFGLLVGYPVVYPYVDLYAPAAYSSGAYASYNPAASPRNTYSNAESVTPSYGSGQTIECAPSPACGGVSFDVAPSNAQVSVDGVFVGTVEEFSGTSEPLALAPGNHYLEVRLPGYRTANIDVTIVAGEVTPYQGALEALRTR
ncbi:MAG TPA: PEGA domain-containing protein [Vicinamibacterales bacterium]|nr:PEGA domain-containing protein [Vicinamibacterales bacterium]